MQLGGLLKIKIITFLIFVAIFLCIKTISKVDNIYLWAAFIASVAIIASLETAIHTNKSLKWIAIKIIAFWVIVYLVVIFTWWFDNLMCGSVFWR